MVDGYIYFCRSLLRGMDVEGFNYFIMVFFLFEVVLIMRAFYVIFLFYLRKVENGLGNFLKGLLEWKEEIV